MICGKFPLLNIKKVLQLQSKNLIFVNICRLLASHLSSQNARQCHEIFFCVLIEYIVLLKQRKSNHHANTNFDVFIYLHILSPLITGVLYVNEIDTRHSSLSSVSRGLDTDLSTSDTKGHQPRTDGDITITANPNGKMSLV